MTEKTPAQLSFLKNKMNIVEKTLKGMKDHQEVDDFLVMSRPAYEMLLNMLYKPKEFPPEKTISTIVHMMWSVVLRDNPESTFKTFRLSDDGKRVEDLDLKEHLKFEDVVVINQTILECISGIVGKLGSVPKIPRHIKAKRINGGSIAHELIPKDFEVPSYKTGHLDSGEIVEGHCAF